MSDLISRADAMSKCKNAENELTDEAERKGLRVARFIIGELPSADALLKQEIDFHKEVSRIEAEKVVDLEHKLADLPSYAEFTDLPDIPRYYYEKVVGKMAHEINMLKEQLESADAEQGEWIVREYCTNELDYHRWIEIECPFCGERPTYENLDNMNYCPNCGARMENTK